MTNPTAMPAHLLPHRTPTQLINMARDGIIDAHNTRPVGLRYAAAHLAALRAAAAILAARATPTRSTPADRGRLTSPWVLLTQVAPELSEWAAFFADRTSKRAAAEAGIPRVVGAQEAEDMFRAASDFVGLVDRMLGGLWIVPWVEPKPPTVAPAVSRG